MIGFFPRAHELYLNAMILQHCRAEILEDGNAAAVSFSLLDMVGDSSRKCNTASFHHYVNVIIRPAKETIAHVTAYDKSSYAYILCYFRDDAENRRVQKSLSHRHIFFVQLFKHSCRGRPQLRSPAFPYTPEVCRGMSHGRLLSCR